jgi:Cu/Ag efflux protein CusF
MPSPPRVKPSSGAQTALAVAAIALAGVIALAFLACRNPKRPAQNHEIERSAKTPSYATLPAPHASAVTTQRGEGQVLRVDAAGGRITIAHKDIPGFMQAMTMSFRVKDRKLLDQVKPGDEADFTLEVSSDSVVIAAIKRKPSGRGE